MRLKQWLSEYKGLEYEHALPFGNVRLSTSRLFWKDGLQLCYVEMSDVRQAWLSDENAFSGTIHKLVLALDHDQQLTLHIGDDTKPAAEELLRVIGERYDHIAIGK